MRTARVKTTELQPGMRLAGGLRRKILRVTTRVVDGGGEFDDYTICIVYLDRDMYVPGRRVPQHAQFGPDDLHTIILDDQETP
jgi:hypothetical protein